MPCILHYIHCAVHTILHILYIVYHMLATHAMLSNLYYCKRYAPHNMRNSTTRTVVYILNYAHFTKYEHFTVHANYTVHTKPYILYSTCSSNHVLRVVYYTTCIVH